MTRITVSVSKALNKHLRAHAEAEGVTLSQAIAQILAHWFEQQGHEVPAQDNAWGGDRKSNESK